MSAFEVAYVIVALSPAMMFIGETEQAVNCAAGCSSTVTVVVAVTSPPRLRAVKRYCVVRVGETGASAVAGNAAEFRNCDAVGIQYLPVERALLTGSDAIRASLEADDLDWLCRRCRDRDGVDTLLTLRILHHKTEAVALAFSSGE